MVKVVFWALRCLLLASVESGGTPESREAGVKASRDRLEIDIFVEGIAL